MYGKPGTQWQRTVISVFLEDHEFKTNLGYSTYKIKIGERSAPVNESSPATHQQNIEIKGWI